MAFYRVDASVLVEADSREDAIDNVQDALSDIADDPDDIDIITVFEMRVFRGS